MGLSAATFDIETTSLNADFGVLLCAVIKPSYPNSKAVVLRADRLNKNWKTKRSDDRVIVKRVAEELQKYDVVCAHNGTYFDLPFIRTRMARWGLGCLPEIKILDPCHLARNKLKMSFNSLERLADFLGFNTKTTVDGDLWIRAGLDGDKKAMDYICAHCEADVAMLEKLVDHLKGYSKVLNSWGSGR